MAIVSTVLRRVTLSQNLYPFFSWHTSSHYSIIAKFEGMVHPKNISYFRRLSSFEYFYLDGREASSELLE
jgi:hypothetical protein